MSSVAYGLPMGEFKQIVDDGADNLRKRDASDEEISVFVSSCWERYFAGGFNISITFAVNKKDWVCAAQELACTRTTQGNAQ